MSYPIIIPDEYLQPFTAGGLTGRRLDLPSPIKDGRTIVLVYGHHPSIERMYSTAQYFNDFGAVTVFDLPGFGGMDSLFKVGKRPTADEYADYLYGRLKDFEPGKQLTIVGLSLGFVLSTRLLQKYPDLAGRVELLISFVGFLRPGDFRFSARFRRRVALLSGLLATVGGAALIKLVIFNRLSLYLLLSLFFKVNPKMKHVPPAERAAVRRMETDLWLNNDLRTHFATYKLMMTEDLTTRGRVALPVINIETGSDQYFNFETVAEGMRQVYTKYTALTATLQVHVPSILGSKDDLDAIMPAELKKVLRR